MGKIREMKTLREKVCRGKTQKIRMGEMVIVKRKEMKMLKKTAEEKRERQERER